MHTVKDKARRPVALPSRTCARQLLEHTTRRCKQPPEWSTKTKRASFAPVMVVITLRGVTGKLAAQHASSTDGAPAYTPPPCVREHEAPTNTATYTPDHGKENHCGF